MDNYFNCKNCKELIDIVYESKCCGELYCHNCRSKLISTKCPKCKASIEFQKNAFAQRLLKNIKVNCTYGCGKILSYDKMKEHLLICEKKLYTCSFDNITNKTINNIPFKGYKKELMSHMIKEHPKILLFYMENYKTLSKKKDITLNKSILNNLNDSISINDELEENTHIEFEHDIQLLNRINDLNLINNNINNFNDLQLSNGINANAPLRINNNSMNNFLGNEVNNSIDDDNNNNIRILDFGLHRNNLNTLRLTNNVSNSNENGDRSNNIHINSINFSDINDNL